MMRSMIFGTITCFIIASGFEYIINYDRLELVFYNKSFVKDGYFLFRKYNRTNFCLNVSFTLLEDLDGNDMKFETSPYQVINNQHKYFGVTLRFNVCEYWKKDIYGTSTDLGRYGNLEGCDIKKGHYYLYNYMPDESFFPKALVLGKFMLEIDVKWNSGSSVLKLRWYVESKLKVKRRKH